MTSNFIDFVLDLTDRWCGVGVSEFEPSAGQFSSLHYFDSLSCCIEFDSMFWLVSVHILTFLS